MAGVMPKTWAWISVIVSNQSFHFKLDILILKLFKLFAKVADFSLLLLDVVILEMEYLGDLRLIINANAMIHVVICYIFINDKFQIVQNIT